MQTFLNHKFDNNFVFITGLSILRVIGNYKYIFFFNYSFHSQKKKKKVHLLR